MAQRVRIPHRGQVPFVCQTTPHFGSTSRRVPTLFVLIIHDQEEKVNTQNENHAFFRFRRPGYTIEVGQGQNPLPLEQFDQIYRDNLGILVTAATGLPEKSE